MWLIRLLISIVAITVAVGFILYNSTQKVDLFFPWNNYYNVPLTLVCLGAFVVGMFVTFVLAVFYYLKVSGEVREKNRQMRKLEVELSSLRNRSLEDLEDTLKGREE